MKSYIVIILFGITFSFFFQKNKEHPLSKKNATTAQLKKLDSLINISKTSNLDSLPSYLEQYIDIAIKVEKYEEAISQTIKAIYFINTTLGQTQKALKLITKIEKIKDKTTNSYLLGNIFLKKGGVYYNGGDNLKAIKNYTLAIENFSSNDSIYTADSYFFRGQAYFNTNDFFNALKNFRKALKYYSNLKDESYVYYTKNSIINIHSLNGFITKAIKERKEIINKKTNSNNLTGLSIDFHNLSKDYKKNKEINNQKECLFKALDYAKKEKNSFNNISFIYSTLSKYYLDENNLTKAKIYFDLTKKHIKSKENDNYFDFIKLKSHYLYKNNKLDKALVLAKECLLKAKKQNYTQNIIEIKELIYKIYTAKNNLPKAHTAYKSYINIKDSIYNIQKLNVLYYYQTQYETTLKEQKIVEQKNNIIGLEKSAENKKIQIYLILITAILAISIIVILLYSFFLRRKKELQDKYSQNLLSYIDKERKRISKDLHDSLGHKLLIIKNHLINKGEKECSLIDDAIDEIRVISKNLQPIQIKQIGIVKSLENLIEQHNKSYSKILFFGEIDNIDNLLSSKQEINIYRIIQECLNNIIKHSQAESAKVSIKLKGNIITITVKDNGTGFSYSEKYSSSKSIGLKNLKTRVKLLNGTIKITSLKTNGTLVKICIPLK